MITVPEQDGLLTQIASRKLGGASLDSGYTCNARETGLLLLPDDHRVPGISGVSNSALIECDGLFVVGEELGEELGNCRTLDSVIPSSLNNTGVARIDEINSRNQRMPTRSKGA